MGQPAENKMAENILVAVFSASGVTKRVGEEIAGNVPDMASYDTVIVGFPIWWGVAPRIIDTFLENYDFSGKKIIPFCTSGGSGVGRSDTALHKDVSGDAEWAKGRQINRPDEAQIRGWLGEVL